MKFTLLLSTVIASVGLAGSVSLAAAEDPNWKCTSGLYYCGKYLTASSVTGVKRCEFAFHLTRTPYAEIHM